MIRRLAVLLVLAIPSVVVAQSGVGPSPIRVGSSGGSSTITAGTTATSGCNDLSVLSSNGSVVVCPGWAKLATSGAFTIGNSSLGTSVVPLTVTPGTGSTANIQNWTNSAGTVLSYVNSAGSINIPTGQAYLYNGLPALQAQTALTNVYGGVAGNLTGSGSNNSAFGWAALSAITSGDKNTVMGYQAGLATLSASNNTFVGYYAGHGVATTTGNTAVGWMAFQTGTDYENTAIGGVTLQAATTATSSTCVGYGACYDVTSGDFNTMIGERAGITISTGSKNTIVGPFTGTATLSNNVILADGDGQQAYRKFAPVTLTEAGGAETVLTLTSATTNTFTVDIDYMVTAKDVTPDYAVRNGSVLLTCINKATAVTCTSSATSEANDGRNGGGSIIISTSAKTLTYAIAVDVATANVAKLTFNIDSDMTVTAASITMTVTINGTVTPS